MNDSIDDGDDGMRTSPIETAKRFIAQHHPNCLLAVLGGSASRDAHDALSDLDIVIVTSAEPDSFRRIHAYDDWLIECIMLSRTNYREAFKVGLHDANPTLQRLIAEGIVLTAKKSGLKIVEVAKNDLSYGPLPWSTSERDFARYMLSEKIADLQGAIPRCEKWFVVGKMTIMACEFLLRTNDCWIGEGKHLYRILQERMPEAAAELEVCLEAVYKRDDHERLASFCERIMEPYGGLLIEGYEG
jgi:predicted nucleotidyltransferase